MARHIKWLVGLTAVALVVWMGVLTMQQNEHRYEVCVTFNNRTHCATAAGRTPQEAIQSAQGIACTLLTTGRDDNMICLQSTNRVIKELPR